MNKDAYDMAPNGPALKPLLTSPTYLEGSDQRGPTPKCWHRNSKIPLPPPTSCFYTEPNHSTATPSAVSCWHNHGAKAKPISMLTKLLHQDFYTYSDFFQSPYQRHSFSKEIFSSYPLRIRKDHLLNTKYYTENSEELWKTTKCFSWNLKAITLGFHSQMHLPWNVMDPTFQSKFLLYKTHVTDHRRLVKYNIPPMMYHDFN